jgi:hypothetical protein
MDFQKPWAHTHTGEKGGSIKKWHVQNLNNGIFLICSNDHAYTWIIK